MARVVRHPPALRTAVAACAPEGAAPFRIGAAQTYPRDGTRLLIQALVRLTAQSAIMCASRSPEFKSCHAEQPL
jgi:hypothetical protein